MTITSDELRNVMFRESLRGYHRTDVDAVCERAAETIEHLEQRIHSLEQGASPDTGLEPGAVRVIGPSERSTRVVDDDTIARTLILAQKTADEAVAEAQARAEQITGESAHRAQALVAEAEATARRIGDEARGRLEADIERLGSTRDALLADVGRLEEFAADLRGRIQRAVEDELARLDVSSRPELTAPPRPELMHAGTSSD